MKMLAIGFLVLTACVAHANECTVPLISMGGGYYDAGPHHSGGVFQMNYKHGRRYLGWIRPQASLVIPRLRSIFCGAGLGLDLHPIRHVFINPSFLPGLYYRGGGRNLGYPIEFKSSFEAGIEVCRHFCLSAEYFHISNASLSHHNPGANGITVLISIPQF
ncbi:MAG: hypothetical protein S4CHLAM123_00990 [Chlamydiales bacterium]|nr:hypothetical protein [Chlamydiales bacterium]